jgi:hypothetical protein
MFSCFPIRVPFGKVCRMGQYYMIFCSIFEMMFQKLIALSSLNKSNNDKGFNFMDGIAE